MIIFVLRLVAVTIALASSIYVDASSNQAPTQKPTFGPTQTPPPACGTILTNDGNDLTLGPYESPSNERTTDAFQCNTGTGHWFAHSYYSPMYLYAFQLTQRCEYQFRTPEGNLEWQDLRDVNSWFEQAAKTFQRPNNVGYKVSDDDIIFSGIHVPDYTTDLITDNIEDCPENFCVKIVGPSITRKSLGSKYNPESSNLIVVEEDAPELLYAFSNEDAQSNFSKMMRDAMRSSNNQHIFLTNHFLRCGCESFCMDEDRPYDSVSIQATCYVEHLCGERVFQIAYIEDYPKDEKAAWASTGTTKVMEWFNECASAMYGCTEHEDSDTSAFRGTKYNSNYNGFPIVFQYNSWKGANNVYGLGGDKYDGFPYSTTTNEPQVVWTCPTFSHKLELREFGEFVASTEFFRDAGLETSVPAQQNPCESEIFNPPDPPDLPPPVGPNCEDVDHVGYCYQMPGATCYAAKAAETCAEVDLVMINETSTYVYGDVADWADACLGTGTNCRKDGRHADNHGTVLYTGLPQAIPFHIDDDSYEWYFMLSNLKKNGVNTVDGSIYYNCDTWENAFGAQNFTNGAGNRHSVFGNTYGDLWEVREGECTPSPSNLPSESPAPSLKHSPTKFSVPSASPTGVPLVSLTSPPSVMLADSVVFSGPTNPPTPDPTRSPSSKPTTFESTSSPIASPSSILTAPLTETPSTSGSPTGASSGYPTRNPTANPTVSPTESPTTSPTEGPTIKPTESPTLEPYVSFAPTDILSDCHDGPMMVQKDSSSVEMCYYNQDMVQINGMDTTDVTLTINNVWTRNAAPEQLRVFIHTNGIDAVLNRQESDGFQCFDTEGSDIDIEGDNEFTVNCYQESQGSPWLAVIDVVITDEAIDATNDVPHPCLPDEHPIFESCSWRIVIPCKNDALCSEQPTSYPISSSTGSPTSLSPSFGPTGRPPTNSPTAVPVASPTASPSPDPTTALVIAATTSPTVTPTARPSTGEPTFKLDPFGKDDETGGTFFPPIGQKECPVDILLLRHNGITGYPDSAVRIINQDRSTVTVKLTQNYTDASSTIDSIYYQYKQNHFDNMCYEEQNLNGKDSVEITIQCTVNSQIALLELWVADSINKNVLSEGDNVIVPKCCNPTIPKETPVTNFLIEIKCVTACSEVFE